MKQYIATLALALLLPAVAHAKCSELTYLLDGQVTDESGRPAVGALVGASWLLFGEAAGPAIAVADSKGRYRLSVRFSPYDDMPLFGEACTDRIGHINVIAYAGDRRSYPARIAISSLNQRLPNIRISEPAASPW